MLSSYSLIILAFCATLIQTRPLHGNNVIQRFEGTKGNIAIKTAGQIVKERERRAVSFATKGLEALKTILSGTKPLKTSTDATRQYEKTGDFKTAEHDFFSFQPRNVRDRNSNTKSWNHRPMYGRVLVGTVGNSRLTLREGLKDRPTVLDIVHLKLGPQPEVYTDRIFYKTVSDRQVP